jgi:CMP-N-acetylneuraminic acid synthetase|tara:strand:- start:1357 stop:2055 length:699 start_codon:yes stop_codon:yes gene_type:complete
MHNKNNVLICARSGSRGIKNKNLKKIGNISLVENSIKLAKKIKNIGEIIVSTDSLKIAKVSIKAGASVPFIRPKKLSGNKTPEIEVWQHAVKEYKKILGFTPENIISLPPTSPLRNKDDIEKCIKLYKTGRYDLVIMGYISNHNPYFNMVVKKNEFVSIVLKTKKNIYRRQDVPKIYNISTSCYIVNTKYLMKTKNLFNGRVGMVEAPIERSIDIDTPLDLFIANKIYNEKN